MQLLLITHWLYQRFLVPTPFWMTNMTDNVSDLLRLGSTHPSRQTPVAVRFVPALEASGFLTVVPFPLLEWPHAERQQPLWRDVEERFPWAGWRMFLDLDPDCFDVRGEGPECAWKKPGAQTQRAECMRCF